MAMSGDHASFLAGGQIPVPVPQGGIGVTSAVTIQWKDFGVMLDFVPYVMENGAIRLTVRTEDSTLDPALGTTLVPGGVRCRGSIPARGNDRRVESGTDLGDCRLAPA